MQPQPFTAGLAVCQKSAWDKAAYANPALMRRSFLEDVPWLFSAIGIDETMCEGNCQLLSSATISKMKDYLDDWMLDCCQTVETPA